MTQQPPHEHSKDHTDDRDCEADSQEKRSKERELILSDDQELVVQQEVTLVPNEPGDTTEIDRGSIARAQNALNQILDNLPNMVFATVRGLSAEKLANAQKTLSEAQAVIEKVSLKKQAQQQQHEVKLRELELSETERKHRQEVARLEALATGMEKIMAGAEKLAAVGLTKAEIKKIVVDGVKLLKEQSSG